MTKKFKGVPQTESNRAVNVKLYKSRGSELVACFVLRGGVFIIFKLLFNWVRESSNLSSLFNLQKLN